MSDIDLKEGVLPISKAASSLAALFRKAKMTGRPIIVTQKGYPTGVILDVESYLKLKGAAELATQGFTHEEL